MTAAMVRAADPVASSGRDWRLVPAAVAVWLATMLGLLIHWWLAAVAGALAGFGGLWILLGARGSATEGARWLRRGVGAALLACGLSVAALTVPRLRDVADDPLRPEAGRGASGAFRVELRERPRPVFSTGFGGRQGGVRTVVVPATVRHAMVNGHPVPSSGRMLVIAPVERWSELLAGQQVEAGGVLAPARPGGLTVAVLRVRGPPEEVTPAPPWQRTAHGLRSGLREASGVLDAEQAGLLPALVVGDTDALSRRVVEEFRIAGMSHLLAVSGANLAIVCVAVLLLLRAVRVGPRGSALGALLALVGFVVLAGPEPSVLRAAVMGAIGLLALVIGRERAALPALATAVVALVLHDPALATSFGFALSVLATGGLVLLAPRWAGRLADRGLPRGLAEALAVPAAAHLVTAPVVAGMTGQVSLVAVLANLLAAPVVVPATVLGVLAAVSAPVLPWLAELLVRLTGPELGWLIMVGRRAARLPGAAIDWPGGWWGGLLLAGLVLLLVVAVRRRGVRVVVALGLTGVLVVVIPVRVIAPGWPPPGWAMVGCDVGQGDAVVLATAEPGRAVVVDTGPEPGPVAACLDRLEVAQVPLVILSHLHADHIGGLAAVLADRSVGAVAVGPARVPGWAWEQVRREAAAARVPLVQVDTGARMSWPGLSIDVLAPRSAQARPVQEADGTEINNSSLVLKAATPAGRVLLTGDVELAAQAALLAARVDLGAEVLKVPHHGSRYTAPEFLDAAGAGVAVVSVGAGNRYGHPSRSTVDALRRRGTVVVRTDEGGDSAIIPGANGPSALVRGDPMGP